MKSPSNSRYNWLPPLAFLGSAAMAVIAGKVAAGDKGIAVAILVWGSLCLITSVFTWAMIHGPYRYRRNDGL